MSVFPPWPATPRLRRLFVRDMVCLAHIGVYPHEEGVRQRIRVNIEYGVEDPGGIGRDDLGRTVSYERVVQQVRHLVESGHVRLVETLAERIAEAVLRETRILVVRVGVEKLDVFPELDSVGVEIERRRG